MVSVYASGGADAIVVPHAKGQGLGDARTDSALEAKGEAGVVRDGTRDALHCKGADRDTDKDVQRHREKRPQYTELARGPRLGLRTATIVMKQRLRLEPGQVEQGGREVMTGRQGQAQ